MLLTCTHTHRDRQARILLIKMFTIVSLKLAHLGIFSPLKDKMWNYMKLEAAAERLRHLRTKDTPSLNISFPYAEADTGWTRSPLVTHSVFLYFPALSSLLWNEGGGKSRNAFLGKGGPSGPDFSGSTRYSWHKQRGENPLPAGWGWPHTHAIHITTQVTHTSVCMLLWQICTLCRINHILSSGELINFWPLKAIWYVKSASVVPIWVQKKLQ